MVTASLDRKNGIWTPGVDEGAPTLDEIMSLHTEGLQYFRGFHDQCRLEDDYYTGRRNVPVIEGVDAVWPATANAIINVGTDHVDINNLAITFPSSPRGRARAEKKKTFCLGAWMNIKKPVLRTLVRQAFLYGISWRKTMWDADRWPEAPMLDNFSGEPEYKEALSAFLDKRKISFPFRADVINPKNLIWDDSKIRPKWAIEFYKAPSRELQRRYPEWVTDGEPMADWMEYWDDEWCAYIANRQFVWGPYKHGYEFMPYQPVLPVHSFTFEDGRPEERYKGILHAAHSLLDDEARLMSQIGAIVKQVAYRSLDFAGPPALAEKAADEYEIIMGKNIIPPGVEVRVSPMMQVPPDLYQQLNVVQTKIEEATFPNVIRGVRPKGVSTGFGISVLAGMGRMVFQGVADGMRHNIEEGNKAFLMLVENKARGPVTVYASTEVHQFDQTIRPEDIKGHHENTVQVKAEAPEERERESLLALRLHQAGVISLYEAQRRAGITNPLEEQMQIRAEMLLNTPEFLASQTQLLLQRIGLPGQMEQAVGGPEIPGTNVGSQNIGGAQLQRPGERGIQQARIASREGTPSVYPQGMPGIDALGSILGGATGGAQGMPSGQTIRR